MAPVDQWEGSESSGLQPYILTIRESRWGHVARDEGRSIRLLLAGEARTDDGKLIDWTPDYSTKAARQDIEASPDGRYLAFIVKDDETALPADGGVMLLVKRAIELGAPLKERGSSPKDAHIWKGLQFRMANEVIGSFTPRDKQTGKDEIDPATGKPRVVTMRQDMPIEYLGEVGAGPAPVAGGSAEVIVGSGTPAQQAVQTTNGADVSDSELMQLAESSTDFFSFVDAATKKGATISDPRLKKDSGVWSMVGKS